MRRAFRVAVLLLLIAVSAVVLGWHYELSRPVRRTGEPAQVLTVAPGESAAAISVGLYGLGLVRHPSIFRLAVALEGAGGELKAGEYSLEGTLSLRDVLAQLVRGDVVRRAVTFPEGKNLAQMAEIARLHGLNGQAFRDAASDPAPIADLDPEATDLEGYLFPDTYDVPRDAEASRELVARMVRQFRTRIDPQLALLEERGLTLRKLVTLASLVELETAREDERPRVAAVLFNRIRRGMLLQIDPTVIYAMRLEGRYDGNIRKRDLEMDSPYNTYRMRGLPPGPIASPGFASLQAVLHPADAEDLYFVSRNDGSHQFSRTLREHERAVDEYQRRRRSSGGG